MKKKKQNLQMVMNIFVDFIFWKLLLTHPKVVLSYGKSMVIMHRKQASSLGNGSYSNRESGPLGLIRTVCKLVQERGCEESGRMATLATFMKKNHQMINLPLYPFLGNSFKMAS